MMIFRMFKYLRPKDWLYACVSLVFIVGQVWLDLKLPDYMSEVVTLAQTPGSDMGALLSAGGAMLACALGSLAFAFLVGYFVAKIAAGLAMRLREGVFHKTVGFSMEEVGKFSTASLITRSTNDITQIQTFVAMGLQALVKAPITAVWAIVKIAGKNWAWTLTTAGAVAVLVAFLAVILALVVPKFTKVQQLTDNLNRLARENLTGIRVIRAYNAEGYQQEKFEQANQELTGVNLFTNNLLAVQRPGMTLVMSGLTLAIYWVGAHLIDAAALPDRMGLFADMVVFSSYAMQVIQAFMMLTMTFLILPRASVSARRVMEVLDTNEALRDGMMDGVGLIARGEIEFDHVSFCYPDAEDAVLHDVSFTVEKGETVAFIGSTGSGKSTLINLIPRFYDVTEGRILVDGMDVRDYRQKALRDKLGYVPQRAVMFRGTIASNVAYGSNDRSEPGVDEVLQAVEAAQAREFVDQMPEGYQSPVAQGGTNLSGGQKQRLSIARAVCRHPEIYIFDDSFSALDYKTDRAVRSALKKYTQGATTLIVAQRIGTILDADKIVVLDEGRVVGIGPHRTLLKTCPVYREIAESQLSKEEIDCA